MASQPASCSDWCQMNSTGWWMTAADGVEGIVIAIRTGKLNYAEFHGCEVYFTTEGRNIGLSACG